MFFIPGATEKASRAVRTGTVCVKVSIALLGAGRQAKGYLMSSLEDYVASQELSKHGKPNK